MTLNQHMLGRVLTFVLSGFAVGLATLDLVAVTTGIVTCPRCDWVGRIEIKVVDSDRLSD
jgi:hypothetical protein